MECQGLVPDDSSSGTSATASDEKTLLQVGEIMSETTGGNATDYPEDEYGKLLEQTWNLEDKNVNAKTFNEWTLIGIISNDPLSNQP